jgi:hypothetical protein
MSDPPIHPLDVPGLADALRRWLLGQFRKVLLSRKIERVLLHLTLKGNFVYGTDNPPLDVDGEAFGALRNGTLDAALPSGDGRRGGTLDLWYWLRLRTTGASGQIVLVALAKSRTLTTAARRTGITRTVALAVDRARLLTALPDSFEVNTRAEIDPARARTTASRLRLAAERTIKVAVEETITGAGDLIEEELRRHEIGLQVEVEPVADLVESLPDLTDRGFDAVLATKETYDALVEVHGDELSTEGAVTL